jgi:6-phosphogluconate dehydrogenase
MEHDMELRMIGLGRMETNMVRRPLPADHQCVVYDLQPEAGSAPVAEGAVGTTSLEDSAHTLGKPRAAWMMVPAAADPTLQALVPLFEPDFADRVLSNLGSEFGRHEERVAEPKGGA